MGTWTRFILILCVIFLCAGCTAKVEEDNSQETESSPIVSADSAEQTTSTTGQTLNNEYTGEATESTPDSSTTSIPAFFDITTEPIEPTEISAEDAVHIYDLFVKYNQVEDWERVVDYGAVDAILWLKTGKVLEGNQLVRKASESLTSAVAWSSVDDCTVKAERLSEEYITALNSTVRSISTAGTGKESPFTFTDGYTLTIRSSDDSISVIDVWKVMCVNGEWKCDMGFTTIINEMTGFEQSVEEMLYDSSSIDILPEQGTSTGTDTTTVPETTLQQTNLSY